jgi:hypothetical protein
MGAYGRFCSAAICWACVKLLVMPMLAADQLIADFFERWPFSPGLNLPEFPAVDGFGALSVRRRI